MRSQPAVAGVIAALVGFSSSLTIVLVGLVAVGASNHQASSGLLVLSVSMGLVGMWAQLASEDADQHWPDSAADFVPSWHALLRRDRAASACLRGSVAA